MKLFWNGGDLFWSCSVSCNMFRIVCLFPSELLDSHPQFFPFALLSFSLCFFFFFQIALFSSFFIFLHFVQFIYSFRGTLFWLFFDTNYVVVVLFQFINIRLLTLDGLNFLCIFLHFTSIFLSFDPLKLSHYFLHFISMIFYREMKLEKRTSKTFRLIFTENEFFWMWELIIQNW